jgi:hypothetical protein
MKYTVRTKEGELVYGSFGAVEQAWLQGLVEPDDEVLEEGTTKWRKAGSIPLLARARRSGNQVWGGAQMAWIVIGIATSSFALYMLATGRLLIGGISALATAFMLFNITTKAFKKSKPH